VQVVSRDDNGRPRGLSRGPLFLGGTDGSNPLPSGAESANQRFRGKAARKADALAGLERWKARYPEAAARLHEDDVLVDSMRGRSTNWTGDEWLGRLTVAAAFSAGAG